MSDSKANNKEILLSTKTFPITKNYRIISENENFKSKKAIFNNISSLKNSRNQSQVNSLINQNEYESNITDEIKYLKDINNKKFKAEISINSNFLILKNTYLEKDVMKYIKTSPNEMEFYEIIKYDKRKFRDFYWDKIKRNQIIIKTFVFKEETIPRELKIILLIIYIDFFFVVTSFFFSVDYISEIFYSNNKRKFFDFFNESFSYMATSAILLSIYDYLMQFFLYDKKYIRHTMKKRKDNEKELKKKIIKVIKKIKISYITFIIISYIISIFSWYYISCFNNVYPYTKYYWIQLCVNILILIQIITLVFPFIESCLRFLAIKCNSEKIYKLSLYINLY